MIQHLVPASDCGDDFIGVGDPSGGCSERDPRPPDVFLCGIAIADQAANSIKIGSRDGKRDASSHPRTRTAQVQQEALPGFKCQI